MGLTPDTPVIRGVVLEATDPAHEHVHPGNVVHVIPLRLSPRDYSTMIKKFILTKDLKRFFVVHQINSNGVSSAFFIA